MKLADISPHRRSVRTRDRKTSLRGSAALLLIRGKRPRIKPRRFLRHPLDERADVGIPAQRLPREIRPQQFPLRKRRVDLAMADLVDRELLPTLQRLRDQVMPVDIDGAERPAAQWTGAVPRRRFRNEIGEKGTARHGPHIKADAPV